MAPWYEEAEFYHIYPIGLTGAPRKNELEETAHRFSTLEQWINMPKRASRYHSIRLS